MEPTALLCTAWRIGAGSFVCSCRVPRRWLLFRKAKWDSDCPIVGGTGQLSWRALPREPALHSSRSLGSGDPADIVVLDARRADQHRPVARALGGSNPIREPTPPRTAGDRAFRNPATPLRAAVVRGDGQSSRGTCLATGTSSGVCSQLCSLQTESLRSRSQRSCHPEPNRDTR